MKKTLTLFLFVIILVSCNSDSDDVFTPQCSEPTNIQFNTTTNESAVITWEDSNASATYRLEYGVSGFTLGDGTVLTVSTTTANLTALNADTSYDIYVQSICPDNVSMQTAVSNFTTLAAFVVPEFLNNLSALNLFSGDIGDLNPSVYTFEYELNTPLFTDYAHKHRLIALPQGTAMDFVDDGLPNFPDNTVIAKTFYYNNDERDASLGQKNIETRVLIKINGAWETGNYKWNTAQTEAILDASGSTVSFNYINENGVTQNLDYEIPSNTDCFTCHSNAGNTVLIGPKMRSINMNNQLQELIDQNLLSNLADASSVSVLPNWEDDVIYSLEQRTRAYFDVNCAHCHSPGGNCYPESNLDLRFETRFNDTNIEVHGASIQARTQSFPLIPNYSMPLIGRTIVHDQGVQMIDDYINSL